MNGKCFLNMEGNFGILLCASFVKIFVSLVVIFTTGMHKERHKVHRGQVVT